MAGELLRLVMNKMMMMMTMMMKVSMWGIIIIVKRE